MISFVKIIRDGDLSDWRG